MKTKNRLLTFVLLASNLLVFLAGAFVPRCSAQLQLFDCARRLKNPLLSPIEPKNTEVAQGRKIPSILMRPYLLGDLYDVRAYGYKAERAAALIYAHFKEEFGLPTNK